MIAKIITLTFLIWGCVAGAAHGVLAEETAHQIKLAEVFQLAKSSDWQTREQAFSRLRDALNRCPGSSPECGKIKFELISLLKKESQYLAASGRVSEDYTEYYAELIDAVAKTGDDRAINVLMMPDVLTTGHIAIDGLAAFGDKAVTNVISQFFQSQVDTEKTSLILVVDSMLWNGKLKEPANIQKAEATLFNAIKDGEPFVRLNAVRGLAFFTDDPGAKQAIVEAASSDPYVIKNDGAETYPVRAEATKFLRKE